MALYENGARRKLMVSVPVQCPYCHSSEVIKAGKQANGTQRYQCQNSQCARRSFLLHYHDRGRVPDELFAAIHDQLGDQAMLELTYITALYLQHAVMSRALRTEWDDVDERIVEVAGPDDGHAVGLDIALPPRE